MLKPYFNACAELKHLMPGTKKRNLVCKVDTVRFKDEEGEF